MADQDNFDIDVFGDDQPAAQDDGQDPLAIQYADSREQDTQTAAANGTYSEAAAGGEESGDVVLGDAATPTVEQTATQAIASTSGDASQAGPPKQAPVQQGTKRKEGSSDDREVAQGATNALLISELHWYQDEDDIRGWANQAGVEDELQELSFNEHKINGKSKGQVFVLLSSPQAATALKRKIDSFSAPSDLGAAATGGRRHMATFHSALNPYKTISKDGQNRREQNNMGNRGNFGQGNYRGNRGGPGGFNNRGGMQNNNNNMMGFNQNRNFSTPSMGGGNFGNQGGMGGFNSGMGGFNNNNNNNNFNRGGGMMGGMNRGGGMMNRGGRGGMMGNMGMPNMMGGMGMGGNMMGMGNMGMGGPMGGMNMGGGFGGPQQSHFNPGYFNQGGQGNMGGGDWGNHPNKRQRQE